MPATQVITQTCYETRCQNPAESNSRSKPVWCMSCIADALMLNGLEALESSSGPHGRRLARCLECRAEAHHNVDYILSKNASGVMGRACRACRAGASRHSTLIPYTGNAGDASRAKISAKGLTPLQAADFLRHRGYVLLSTMGSDTSVVTAQHLRCGKIVADAICLFDGDCTCLKNTQRVGGDRALLSESDNRALDWWNHELNSVADFKTVTLRAQRVCYWICPECSYGFRAKVNDMASRGLECPKCQAREVADRKARREALALRPVSEFPELAAAWDETEAPEGVMVAFGSSYRFTCPSGHTHGTSALDYLEKGCPVCRGVKTRMANKGSRKMLSESYPELAAQWHPRLNKGLLPSKVPVTSKRSIWWLAGCCGYEWQETPRERNMHLRLRCPKCRTILDSLGWRDPGLAAEWGPENPITVWDVRPNTKTGFVPKWVCSTDDSHEWEASVSSRSGGAGCPECRTSGKSKIELEYFAGAKSVFRCVKSGAILRDPAFQTRSRWSADICAEVGNDKLVIEYDGAYWHKAPAKVLVDERKTADLLDAGFLVVRLREDDLPDLAIEHPRLIQMRVYSSTPKVEEALRTIQEWAISRHSQAA